MREWKTAAELAQRNESTRLTKQQFGQATESTQRPGRIRKLLGDGREKRGGGDEPEDGPTSNGAGVRSSSKLPPKHAELRESWGAACRGSESGAAQYMYVHKQRREREKRTLGLNRSRENAASYWKMVVFQFWIQAR